MGWPLTHYFLDSSALVKRYVPEVETAWVRTLTALGAGHTIMVGQVTQAEIVSAVARRGREGSIPLRTAHAIRRLVDRHTRCEYVVISLRTQVLRRAEDLLERHPLRAYDAVQLASGLESNDRLVAAGLALLVFVSADTRLLAIAQAEWLPTDDPNMHP